MTRRHKLSATHNAPLEKDITRAMKLLVDHNLFLPRSFEVGFDTLLLLYPFFLSSSNHPSSRPPLTFLHRTTPTYEGNNTMPFSLLATLSYTSLMAESFWCSLVLPQTSNTVTHISTGWIQVADSASHLCSYHADRQ